MRHLNKALLASALKGESPQNQPRGKKRKLDSQDERELSSDDSKISAEDIEVSRNSHFVIDGGALLHKVTWSGSTFEKVLEQYHSYVKSKYGTCTIVFDGYNKRSTKDHKHIRAQNCQTCADLKVTKDTMVRHTREDFLSNGKNKDQLIEFLSQVLRESGHTVTQSEEDADTQIVDAAVDISCAGKAVTVVADDTDILVLLVYFWNSAMGDIFLMSEPKKYQSMKLVNIKTIAQSLDRNVMKNLLFIHAWGGCDTTSATFNQGKTAVMKLVKKGDHRVLDICSVIDKKESTQEGIGSAGIKLFITMYGKYSNIVLILKVKSGYRELKYEING